MVDLWASFAHEFKSFCEKADELLVDVEQLADEQLRVDGGRDQVSILWCIWSMSRAFDAQLARRVDVPQVIDDPGWIERLNITREDAENAGAARLGADSWPYERAKSSGEVERISRQVDFSALQAYWRAVAARTLDLLPVLEAKLGRDDLDEAVGGRYVSRTRIEGGRPVEESVWMTQYRSGREGRTRPKTPVSIAFQHARGCLNRASWTYARLKPRGP